ncbi:hypothetical protein WN51_01370 [Melipona quadrifasciata]|uniref:Uncharacterized protein n=1 Tax=Melipona quadrifasciata TaxID=166423 RepID=A0A0N1ITF1_9HYME|nr:hypothetical protein WN51_01370 [Melipona quadrifasciata]
MYKLLQFYWNECLAYPNMNLCERKITVTNNMLHYADILLDRDVIRWYRMTRYGYDTGSHRCESIVIGTCQLGLITNSIEQDPIRHYQDKMTLQNDDPEARVSFVGRGIAKDCLTRVSPMSNKAIFIARVRRNVLVARVNSYLDGNPTTQWIDNLTDLLDVRLAHGLLKQRHVVALLITEVKKEVGEFWIGLGTQPRLQYKHSHDVDPGYSIGRAMRQSSKASHGPDYRQHPLSDPLRGKDITRVTLGLFKNPSRKKLFVVCPIRSAFVKLGQDQRRPAIIVKHNKSESLNALFVASSTTDESNSIYIAYSAQCIKLESYRD